MKIINIGILAHVDAGKTTLTESLLYASGAISEPGSVEKDNEDGHHVLGAAVGLPFKRQSLPLSGTDVKLTLWIRPATWILAEVYRSLAVLDGAILVISAKDGVQAQTRILFHALRKMNIPTVIFINKIDQLALICRAWFSLSG